MYGKGLSLNGTNQYVTSADIDFPSGPFTLSGWFKTGTAQRSKIVSKYASSKNQIYVMMDPAGGVLAGLYDGTDWQEVLANQNFADNAWHHFAMVVSTTTVELFVDGISRGLDSHDNSFPVNNSVWNMGRSSNNTQYFLGFLDEIKLYSKALTATEVVTDRDTALGGSPQDTTPPVISNGAPTGSLPAGTTSTTISAVTNENATCKWGTTAGTSFASQPNMFMSTGTTSHSTSVAGLTDGTSYNFYVRCQDPAGNANSSDYIISFSVSVSSPPSTGLLAAYGMNEGSGATTADVSGNGRTANIVGATWTTGMYGKGLSLNGTNQYVTSADIDFPSGPFTLSGWFKTGTAQRSKIVSKYASSKNQIYVMMDPAGGVLAGLYDGTDWQEVLANQNFADNAWHHFAMVVSTTTVELFVDGISRGLDSHDNSFPVNNSVWNMGRSSDNTQYFFGILDEIKLYSKALTATEVVADMNTPLP